MVTNTNILEHEKKVLGLFSEKRNTLGVRRTSTMKLLEKSKTAVFTPTSPIELTRHLAKKSLFSQAASE